jgi:trans-aconitate methyltransferase
MPTSAMEGKPWLIQRILALQPESILDIGAGSGTYGKLFRPHFPNAFMTAVEIHSAYVSDYKLWQTYDSVVIGDARTCDLPIADVVILGDVLEHMSQRDALELWDRCRNRAVKGVFLSVPIIEWPQGEVNGNPHERHVHTWSHAQALELPGITDWWTGSSIGCYESLSTKD